MTVILRRLLGAVLVATLATVGLAFPAGAVEDETSAGFQTVLQGTNDYRQLSGVDRLVHDPRMSAVAQAWAEQMSADLDSSGSMTTAFRHNPNMPSQVPAGWEAVGENIAMNGGYPLPYDKLLQQWRDSPGHNANMLNSRWTHIGIGTFQDSRGFTWGVQVFADYGSPASIPDSREAIVDVDDIAHSGTVACVVLKSEPSGAEFFRQCGTRPGNVFTFSDVPAGSYSVTLLAAGGGVLNSGWPITPVPRDMHVVRLAGDNRYATAAAVSAYHHPSGADAVVVSTGADFPDALSGAVVAADLGAPLLLTAPGSIPAETASELGRLDPSSSVVLGGSGVVSDAVAAQLGAFGPVTRLAGSSRYETSVEISKYAFPSGAPVVVVAVGSGFADALAGGPLAAKLGGPVLLTASNALPASVRGEITRLHPTTIVVLGGTGSISDAVYTQLSTLAPSTVRLAGSDRYATAVAISQYGWPNPASVGSVYVATGANFPDALAGASEAAARGVPILLTASASLPAAVATEVDRLGVETIYVLGGTGSVTYGVVAALAGHVAPS